MASTKGEITCWGDRISVRGLPLVSASALPAPAALPLDAVPGLGAAAAPAVPRAAAAAATAATLLGGQFVLCNNNLNYNVNPSK